LYKVSEVAGLFGVSADWVRDRIHDGTIRITQLGVTRGKWRVSGAELRRVVAELTPRI
jgi:excisionase family DNA binding protein